MIQSLVPILRPRTENLGEEKRFLILSTTGLGDTLWGTPAIRALKKSFPTSYIGIVTSPVGKTLLQHNPHLSEILVAKDPLAGSLVSLYRTLKGKKITHILNFHISQRPMLPLAAVLGAQEIIGTCGTTKGLDVLLTHALDHSGLHEIQRRLHIAAQVGAHSSDPLMELFVGSEDEKTAGEFLESLTSPPHFPLVALHPGAKDRFKRWPATHFIELGNLLVRNLGCQILVTGTSAEQPLIDSISSHIEGAVPVTHLPLLALAALIRRVDLMIANDTGPMHLSFALRTPTIGLFTPTDPHLCGPHHVDTAIAISKKPTCTPCLRKKCLEPFCLLQIGVQEVYNRALNLFKRTEKRSP